MANNVIQTPPKSHSDRGQAALTMTIEIKGQETEDIKLALEALMRLVGDSYTSGFDRNGTGSYRFSID